MTNIIIKFVNVIINFLSEVVDDKEMSKNNTSADFR